MLDQQAIGYFPTFGRKGVRPCAAPALGGFAIPEQPPACGFLRFRQRVQRGNSGRGRGHFLEADVAPADLSPFPRLVSADAVDLQRNESARRHSVLDVRAGGAVEPGLDGIADGLDPNVIPVLRLEDAETLFAESLSLFAIHAIAGEQPAASRLVIDSRAPETFAWNIRVNLHLIAVNATGGKLERPAFPLHFFRRIKTLTANLHAGVQPGVHLEIVFEDEVAIVFFRAEKRVCGIEFARADDGVALHGITGLTTAMNPTCEAFAVKKIAPAFVRVRGRGQCQCGQCQKDGLSHIGSDIVVAAVVYLRVFLGA